jgi:hypothetical protein
VSFSRIGSSVNFLVTPYLAYSVPLAVWVGACMTCVSFAFCLIAGGLDWYGEKEGRIRKVVGEEPPKLTHVRYFPASAWILFFICFFFYVAVLTFYTVASQIMQFSGTHLYGYALRSTPPSPVPRDPVVRCTVLIVCFALLLFLSLLCALL